MATDEDSPDANGAAEYDFVLCTRLVSDLFFLVPDSGDDDHSSILPESHPRAIQSSIRDEAAAAAIFEAAPSGEKAITLFRFTSYSSPLDVAVHTLTSPVHPRAAISYAFSAASSFGSSSLPHST